MNKALLRRADAELVGTYGLVTAGCGAIMVNADTGALGHIGIAATFGLIIMVLTFDRAKHKRWLPLTPKLNKKYRYIMKNVKNRQLMITFP